MTLGKFDTDSEALKRRIEFHEKYSSNDLNKWVFNHLKMSNGMLILELGCGTGKQSIQAAHLVGEEGKIIVIDVSKESISVLMEQAEKEDIKNRISPICVDFDDMNKHIEKSDFDMVFSCYSLYYTKNPEKVFDVIHKLLKIGGMLFFCGPSKDNNKELIEFHYNLLGEAPPSTNKAVGFMEKTGLRLANQLFNKVETFEFENPLRLDSPEALYKYWSSYNLYNESIDKKFKDAAHEHFKNNLIFETVKRAVGIRAIK